MLGNTLGYQQPKQCFKNSEGIHVLPNCKGKSEVVSLGDGFWDQTDKVSAVQSIHSSKHLPDHPTGKWGHLLREKSVLNIQG